MGLGVSAGGGVVGCEVYLDERIVAGDVVGANFAFSELRHDSGLSGDSQCIGVPSF